MKAAVALTAETRLLRALLAGLALTSLASCGGGGGDDFVVTRSSNNGWIAIDWTSATRTGFPYENGFTDENFVNLEGRAFMEASSVSWANTTTGKSGETDHGVGCSSGFFILCEHSWWAEVPLVTGANVIQVTASDGAGNSETDTITITRLADTVPPTVISHWPPNRATDVSIDSVISVVFGDDMDGSTITSRTFRLQDSFGNLVAAVVSLSFGSYAALDPIGKLTPSTTYRAVITPDVRDIAGNALATTFEWTFTTRAN